MVKRNTAPGKSGGLFKKILLILTLCILLALFFFAGTRIGQETAKPVITSELLGQQLRSVQELVSVEYYYTNMGKFENQVIKNECSHEYKNSTATKIYAVYGRKEEFLWTDKISP